MKKNSIVERGFNCGCCGNDFNVGNFSDTHNTYGYLCPECFAKGVESSKGMFVPKCFIEKHTEKKSARHGCLTSWEVVIPKEDIATRAMLVYEYAVVRMVDRYVSTTKCGTWQMSKVVADLKERGYTVTANFTKRQNGKSYHLDNATPETIIELVRNVSAIGYLSDKAIKKYGLTTR